MKNNSKTFLAVLATGLLSCGLMSQHASAVPITGGISYAGAYIPQTTGPLATESNLLLATQLAFDPAFVTGANGSFAAGGVTPGQSISMTTPLVFRPVPILPVPNLWSLTGSAAPNTPFTFELTSFFEDAGTTSNTLTLRGTGLIKSTTAGLDPTVGSWVATFNSGGGTFSWSASQASVPDGGMTVALLGLAMVGLVGLRKKLAVA